MPVFRSGKGLAPEWCEMECFDITELVPGDRHAFERVGKKEKLIVAKGRCRVAFGDQLVEAQGGANLSLTPGAHFEVLDVLEDATLVRMCGRWGDEVGGSGIFWVEKAQSSGDSGDPVDYPKETGFDSHYHDCDEYWIMVEGRGVAVSEGRHYEIVPGDCLATGMGHHHDLPIVHETMVGVFFETTLEGQKRLGHLWEHTHGPAEPRPDRVGVWECGSVGDSSVERPSGRFGPH